MPSNSSELLSTFSADAERGRHCSCRDRYILLRNGRGETTERCSIYWARWLAVHRLRNPSAFGAIMAVPERRVFLFTGDGALQLTAQEISTMLYYGCKPIIFVLNNDGYTIEKYLNVKQKSKVQQNSSMVLYQASRSFWRRCAYSYSSYLRRA